MFGSKPAMCPNPKNLLFNVTDDDNDDGDVGDDDDDDNDHDS